MGTKILVTAKIENLEDLLNVHKGTLKPEQVRSVEVTDAEVDVGATFLSLPKRIIARLGLHPFDRRYNRTNGDLAALPLYGVVRLTVQGHDWSGDVVEVSDDWPVVIGRLTLEWLDLVIDPQGQRLIGNPDHGGEQMVELY